MNRAIRISAAPHAAFRRLSAQRGGVLLHLHSTAYFQVNELGAIIWQMVQDAPTFDQLASRVRAVLDDPPADLEGDISRFLDQLTARDLVVVEATT